ncbi:MAG: hypothetical protein ACI9SK_000886 [Zhongshania sp.]|jgi:hypothetical protein
MLRPLWSPPLKVIDTTYKSNLIIRKSDICLPLITESFVLLLVGHYLLKQHTPVFLAPEVQQATASYVSRDNAIAS